MFFKIRKNSFFKNEDENNIRIPYLESSVLVGVLDRPAAARQREARLGHGGVADPSLRGQRRVVVVPAHTGIQILSNLRPS